MHSTSAGNYPTIFPGFWPIMSRVTVQAVAVTDVVAGIVEPEEVTVKMHSTNRTVSQLLPTPCTLLNAPKYPNSSFSAL